jgi:hypothetical protein
MRAGRQAPRAGAVSGKKRGRIRGRPKSRVSGNMERAAAARKATSQEANFR